MDSDVRFPVFVMGAFWPLIVDRKQDNSRKSHVSMVTRAQYLWYWLQQNICAGEKCATQHTSNFKYHLLVVIGIYLAMSS